MSWGFRFSGFCILLLTLPIVALGGDEPALPQALTELGNLSNKSKLTAGDIVELSIQPPTGVAVGAEPEIAGKLKDGPVEWGTGRILYWKPGDPNSQKIIVGLTSYTPGPFQIAAIPFTKDGKPVFSSQPKSADYTAIGGDKSQDDIYPPVGSSVPRWVWVLLSLLVLALALAGIWVAARWHNRRKAKIEELARAPKILTPLEEFEKVCADTETRGYVAKEKFKPHYFALSEAAKRYLGRVYRFDAEERTTRELIAELEALGVSDKLVDQWEKIFDEMDVTKFTDQVPESSAAQSLSERLIALVRVSQ